VLALVAARLTDRDDVPVDLQSLMRKRVQQAAVRDMLRESDLKAALGALDHAGINALLIKGGQLAYSHYPRPDLRPREDSDLFVPATSRAQVHDVLLALGYIARGQMTGELVAHQASYVKYRDDLASHIIDLHWKIANSQVFAGVLSYEELAKAAVPIPRLGGAARGLCDMHALFLACVHRVAHHFDSDHLIWLYDIHLIARRMTAADWDHFISLAAERQVVEVCRRSLERAAEIFRTEVPPAVWSDRRFQVTPNRETTAAYLNARPHLMVIVDDLRALPRWRDRWRLAREHLFPPSHYMRTVYAPRSRAPLAWLYARRMVVGAKKWLRVGS